MYVFGTLLLIGALLALVYYLYRQSTGSDCNVLFSNNYVARHPELRQGPAPKPEVSKHNLVDE